MCVILSFAKITVFMFIANAFAKITPTVSNEWTLRVLHTNDMHARFEETSALSTQCQPRDASANNCYGGFARIATLVRRAKNSSTPTLFLNAGDTYQGTAWFTVHKWKIVSKFLSILKPDAISLGNHEFDDGPDGLIPFINEASKVFPIVTCNLNLTLEPELAATNISNSVVLTVDGKKIGIIGYLTPETQFFANAGNVIILDEITSIRKEVKNLQDQGVNILIALGHSGFVVDKKIAEEVEGLDLVIGGHTNTFLYNGKQPDIETIEGMYPTEVIQKISKRKVYVVQAYAYTKYLGNITINFDANGEIVKIFGNPILVNGSIEQAKDVLDELEKWRPALNNLTHTKVGFTKVLLQGAITECRRRECNLGNLITDSIIEYNVFEYASNTSWTDAAIAVYNGGSIRSSIDKTSGVPIMMSDVLAVLPFNNVIGKINITGKVLLEVLEFSVNTLHYNDTSTLHGKFLQFSGIQVSYDLFNPPGSRVVSVYVRCADCRVPEYEPLMKNKTYTVLISDFLHSGGDGYQMLKGLPWISLGVSTDYVLTNHIKQQGPVYPGVEWRITFLSKEEHDECNNNATTVAPSNTDGTDGKSRNSNGSANSIRTSEKAIILMIFVLYIFL